MMCSVDTGSGLVNITIRGAVVCLAVLCPGSGSCNPSLLVYKEVGPFLPIPEQKSFFFVNKN